MLRSRFLWQLGASFGAVIIVITLVFGWVTSSQVQSDTRENIKESLKVQASLLRHVLVPYLRKGEAMPADVLIEMTSGTDNRVTIIDDKGRVLADNREDPAVMTNHRDRPEILRAASHGIGVSERHSATLDRNMLYVALAVREADRLLGFVRVAVPLARVDEQLATLRNRIFMSAALVGGLCLLLVFFLAGRITRPITGITNVATRLAQGEYSLRLTVDRQDEIGSLAAALNEMAKATEDRIEALTHSRNQLEAVLSGLTEGVIAVDGDERVLHINHSAREMLDVPADDITGTPLWKAVRINEIARAVDTCLRERAPVNATVSIDGSTLDVSVTRLNGEGGAILVLQDVTEMLRLEKVRGDFVANASHELKTPISAIRGLVETILDDPDMSPEVRNGFVERINNQSRRLDNIVQDLIHLSRFDAGADHMALTRVDLCDLVVRVYNDKQDDADQAGVAFTLDVRDGGIEVDGEPEALQQMLINLVDNAFKYTSEDGRVVLRLTTLGSMAVMEVEDDGIGIEPGEQQRIFERFYRVDKGRSRTMGGTGLGLAIVKHIARSHRGSVTVESAAGRGSLFSVRVPLASDKNRT